MSTPGMTSPPSVSQSARRWRSNALVWPFASFFGFFGLAFAIAPADASATVGERIGVGITGAIMLMLCARLLLVGVRVDDRLVRVRGLFRTRTFSTDAVAGVASEVSVSGGWQSPVVVGRDGRTARARWLGARTGSDSGNRHLLELASAVAAHARDDDAAAVLAAAGRPVEGVVATASQWLPPPNWPAPPPGWRPPVGWMPPADWPEPPPDWDYWRRVDLPRVTVSEFAPEPDEQPVAPFPEHLDKRFRLDRRVATDRVTTQWGFGQVAQAFGWLAMFVAATVGIAYVAPNTLVGVIGEGGIGVAALLGGRHVIRQAGGLSQAFGWSLPRWREIGVILRWTGWAFLAQFVATLIVVALIPELRDDPATNTEYLEDLRVLELFIEIPTVVVLAPVVEEIFFRGLLLRAAMRRFSFWPSAMVTSLLFGLAHAPAVDTGLQAIEIAVATGVFGVIQCMVVRRTATLGPAIALHGLHNAVAVGLTLATS